MTGEVGQHADRQPIYVRRELEAQLAAAVARAETLERKLDLAEHAARGWAAEADVAIAAERARAERAEQALRGLTSAAGNVRLSTSTSMIDAMALEQALGFAREVLGVVEPPRETP